MGSGFFDAAGVLEGTVANELALADYAVVDGAVLDPRAAARLAQVGKVHAFQAAQRGKLGEIERPVRRQVEHRMDLVEPRNALLELEQFRFRGRRDDDVEVQVVEAWRVAFLVGKRGNISLGKPRRRPPDRVFREDRTLQQNARGSLHLEDIIRRDQHGIRMDVPLRQPDEFLDDFPNRAQTTVLQ